MRDFSRFLSKLGHFESIQEITRSVILDYISDLEKRNLSYHTKSHRLYQLNTFFVEGKLNGWFNIDPSSLIYKKDYPKKTKRFPRYIPEEVLNQLDTHLDDLPQPVLRMVLIIRECGLRVGELCQLPLNCLYSDGKNQWRIQFMQWKMNKEHTIPISYELAQVIEEQQKYIRLNLSEDKNQPKPKKAPSASDDSKSVIIYNLREENKKLKGQIEQFRKANESLTGRLYQLQDSSNLAERLKAENARLVEENQRLQSELTSAKEELEECQTELRNANPKVVSIDSLRKAGSQEEVSHPSPNLPEEEISNPEESIYDLIKPRLKEVGIRLSKKLNELIDSLQKEEVLNALSAVEEYLATGKQVKSKAGLFRKALEEKWTPNLTDEERQFNQVKESFGEWYKLAKNEGLVQASMGTKEGIMVLEPTGEWTFYEEIVKRGWTLEYLEERAKI